LRGNRIFILGAGFSFGAGLPLGLRLWEQIRSRTDKFVGLRSRFNSDLDLYRQYRRECDGLELRPEDVEFEDFLAFLDFEFRLRLSGSDTWSAHGNKTQVLVKQLIAQILHETMPQIESVPNHYLDFAKMLEPNDYVISFNYDTLLEQLLDRIGKPYRLFPMRYSSVNPGFCTIDSARRDEVIIYKVHGSIDWFDRSQYEELEKLRAADGYEGRPRDAVFGSDAMVAVKPIVDGPRPEDDPLQKIYRVVDAPPAFYASLQSSIAVPCLLTPSHAKALYVEQFAPFWNGMGQAGGLNRGLVIIGYSMPKHDEYARQALFRLAHNYQGVEWGEAMFWGGRKAPVILVDLKTHETDQAALRRRYGFLDSQKTRFVWAGFGTEAIATIQNGGLVT
jgi:hypothetical protein